PRVRRDGGGIAMRTSRKFLCIVSAVAFAAAFTLDLHRSVDGRYELSVAPPKAEAGRIIRGIGRAVGGAFRAVGRAVGGAFRAVGRAVGGIARGIGAVGKAIGKAAGGVVKAVGKVARTVGK